MDRNKFLERRNPFSLRIFRIPETLNERRHQKLVRHFFSLYFQFFFLLDSFLYGTIYHVPWQSKQAGFINVNNRFYRTTKSPKIFPAKKIVVNFIICKKKGGKICERNQRGKKIVYA